MEKYITHFRVLNVVVIKSHFPVELETGEDMLRLVRSYGQQGRNRFVLHLVPNNGCVVSAEALRSLVLLGEHVWHNLKGDLVLVNSSETFHERIRVEKLHEVFSIYASVSSAILALSLPKGLGP